MAIVSLAIVPHSEVIAYDAACGSTGRNSMPCRLMVGPIILGLFIFDAFSSREPVPASLENAMGFVANKKAAPGGAAFEIQTLRKAYAASEAFSCTGPESRPLASTSRSTNSITAIGALSP
ncbi:hypothetical protein SAMN05444050_6638 [Afipia sp. GAS231]|nr:hypothetical protein SAMN05444050_6638 [Afipia sp. GAS231]